MENVTKGQIIINPNKINYLIAMFVIIKVLRRHFDVRLAIGIYAYNVKINNILNSKSSK